MTGIRYSQRLQGQCPRHGPPVFNDVATSAEREQMGKLTLARRCFVGIPSQGDVWLA